MADSNFENKLVVATLCFLVFVLVILPLSLTFAISLIPGGVQPPLGNTIKIYETLTYKQSFISPEANLAGIGVSIKNPNFANKKDLAFKLLDNKDTPVREVMLSGKNIADGKFVKILFEKIQNSKDKEYSWSVSSAQSSFDDALEIFLTDKQPSWSLGLRLNDKVLPDGLSYVTLHRPANRSAVLATVLSSFVSKVKEDKIFFFTYGLLVVVLLILLSRFRLKNLKRPLKD